MNWFRWKQKLKLEFKSEYAIKSLKSGSFQRFDERRHSFLNFGEISSFDQ